MSSTSVLFDRGSLTATVPDANSMKQVLTDDADAFRRLIETHTRELRIHCYRMLGSLQDAEDVVQETFARAWRRRDTFEGRSSVRTWLYKIATNACLDALARRPRRLLPDGYGPPREVGDWSEERIAEPIWLEPYPDSLLDLTDDAEATPEARAVAREGIELAFLAAIQDLPPRQRAVLVLRDVLDWHAAEVAALLETSVASVNSALQRARATLKRHFPNGRDGAAGRRATDAEEQAVLDRYVRVWDDRDVSGLVALLKEDAVLTMPPIAAWYRGRDAIAWFLSTYGFEVTLRYVRTRANGRPALAAYVWNPERTRFQAVGLTIFTIRDGLIAEMTAFASDEPALFRWFDLPAEWPE